MNILVGVFSMMAVAASNRLAMGEGHTAFIQTDGVVYAVGQNQYGQLGDGTAESRQFPVVMLSSPKLVVDICAGSQYTCVVHNQVVKCTGMVFKDQEPNDVRLAQYVIARVPGSTSTTVAVKCGANHACARGKRGGLRCMGNNDFGQLGTGRRSPSTQGKPLKPLLVPVKKFGASGVLDFGVGGDFTCVLTVRGKVHCLGRNEFGAATGGTLVPIKVTWTEIKRLGGRAVSVECGHMHACVVLQTGGVKCWGSNSQGQLSNAIAPDTSGTYGPVVAVGLTSARHTLRAGREATCAIAPNTLNVTCIGNTFSSDNSQFPGPAAQVSLGDYKMCVLLAESGEVRCFPDDDYDPGFTLVPFPVVPPTPTPSLPQVAFRRTPLRQLAVGQYHAVYRQANGKVFAWGINHSGELGIGSRKNQPAPVQMKNIRGAFDICVGAQHTCVAVAESAKDQVLCAGRLASMDDYSRDLYEFPTPFVTLAVPQGTVQVECGASHACALSKVGGLVCWGDHGNGAFPLGNLTGTPQVVAVPVEMAGVVQSALGGGFTCVLKANGQVKCSGRDLQQTANNHYLMALTPVAGLPSPVAAIVAGDSSLCAMLAGSNEGVWCWGKTDSAFLPTPTRVMVLDSLPSPLRLMPNKNGACVLSAAATATCIKGYTNVTFSHPGVAEIAAANNLLCIVLSSNGKVQCQGSDEYGQLGNGPTTPNSTSVLVNVKFKQ